MAARECLSKICESIDNRDVEPFIPALVSATIDHEEVIECVQKLASTTFVQTVTAAPLALIAPLLLLGFRVRSTATKRMCAVIINNMSKLVEDPEDAAPFLPKLMPALEKAKEEVTDLEARTVCGKAFEQLQSIEERLKTHSSVKAVPDVVAKEVANAGVAKDKAAYVQTLASSLVNCKVDDDDDWADELKAYGVAEATAKQLFAPLAKLYFSEVVEEDDGDDAELLCDCKFTLAHGSKVLLHNTKLKLKRGHKYGLLGGNDSGKTTLMRSIANEQVDGFPPASELRTVFVEADIIGELSDLPCVDYILADPRIKKAGISEEVVERMLISVGFGEMQNKARARDVPLRRVAHEARARARDVPQRGHPADGRAHEPPGRDEREVGGGVPSRAEERDVHHRLARHRPPGPRVQQHHRHRHVEAEAEPRQLERVRREEPQGAVVLRAQEQHRIRHALPSTWVHRGGQDENQTLDEDGRRHLHLPGERGADGEGRHRAGVAWRRASRASGTASASPP